MEPSPVQFFPPGSLPNGILTYVIVGTRLAGKWVFVHVRSRKGWEMPAGHIEPGESPGMAAARELREETGATDFGLTAVSDYGVHAADLTLRGFGRLYLARVRSLDPHLRNETDALAFRDSLPPDLGFPQIQSALFQKLRTYLRNPGHRQPTAC